MKLALMFFLTSAITVRGATVRFALGMVESGNDDFATGKAGEVSRFQIKPSVWKLYAPTEHNYRDPDLAWRVADTILKARSRRFKEQTGRQPTAEELYVLWNAPGQLFEGKVSKTVWARAARFRNVLENVRDIKP